MKHTGFDPDLIVTHYGENPEEYFGAVVPPIYQNSLNVYPTVECYLNGGDEKHPYVYMRVSNPTIRLAEEKLAQLEHADDCLCFASGMAAISSATLACVKSGDHIVAVKNCYGPQHGFMENYLSRFGVTVTFVPGESVDDFINATQDNTVMYYLESPTSIYFQLQDLEAIAKFAKSRNIFTLIDNSWASPIFQQPIDFGIDAVLHSASKYLGGHSDIVAGVLCGSQEFIDRVRGQERSMLGGILHPQQAFLLTRGLRTLPIRMKNHQENAMKVAKFLEDHPKVRRVHYPGLESHPQHELAKRLMHDQYSGMIAFDIVGDEAAHQKFLDALNLVTHAVSLGDIESLIVYYDKSSDKLPHYPEIYREGFFRFSVGLENENDLIADLKQAMEAAGVL